MLNAVVKPSWLEGRSVCVITEDNAVRCDGLATTATVSVE